MPIAMTSLRTFSRALTAFLLSASAALAAPVTVTSPDGRLVAQAGLDDSGSFTYALKADGRDLLAPSRLALEFGSAGLVPTAGWTLRDTRSRATDSAWKPLWGKRSVVPDRYRETTFELAKPGNQLDRLTLTIRLYDDGLALRYSVPADATVKPGLRPTDGTEYRFTSDFTTWSTNGERHNHGPEKIEALQERRLPVMVLQAAPDAFLALHEAHLTGGEPLQLERSGPLTLRARARLATLAPGYQSPWRVILFGRSPGALVDSHLIELLNPDPQGDFSWVRPGVAVWDWRIDGAIAGDFRYGMNYPSWVRMVDFAAANGMPHLVLDANWYGPEHSKESDPLKGDKAADVQKIIAYAKTKNVGVWLYLNDAASKNFPIDVTLAQYERWGAAGVKYGFMKGSMEQKNLRTIEITELCARHKLLINFHDIPVHPHGQMRTWPNAVTREFCQAQLDAKKVFQPDTFVHSVFINMLAGPIDMNNGMFDLRQGRTTRKDNSLEVPSTLVSEAARTLIVFSGATVIPDIPEFYQKYPDLLRFIAAQQMPWRESRTVSGVIGEHIVMARESAKGVWLVGAATDESARELDIPLSFLPAGTWQATIVQDGEDAHYLTNRETLRTEHRTVRPADTVRVKLAPGGGACVLLEPAAKKPVR
jgi:alpha-glucosidase